MDKAKTYEKAEIKKLPNAEVEISVTISGETLDALKNEVLETLSKTLELDGFRKGKAPKDVVLKHVGDATLLKETAERALQSAYPNILIEENIDAIGYPMINITKLAWGNPLLATLRTAVVPEVTLPDYKKIAEKHYKETGGSVYAVSDKEIDDVLLELRKGKAHSDWHQANPDEKDHDNHPDFSKEENLPILDEKFAALMGPFKTVDELKEQIKKNIGKEKEMKDEEKNRIALFDEILDKTKADIPNILVESELAKMLGGLKDDVARAGVSFEDYLKEIKKTEEDIRKEWRVGAEKRAKLQLVMNEIAKKEGIKPDQAILENEVKKLSEHYKDADPERIRIYVETTLINEEVVKMLTKPQS